MLITRETDYALRILRALAGGEQLTTAELANGEQIPQQFAYKILKKLQKNGLIKILRGTGGGCILNTELRQISLYRLMQAMEGELLVNSCMNPDYVCSWCKAHEGVSCHANVYLNFLQGRLDEELKAHNLQEILFGK